MLKRNTFSIVFTVLCLVYFFADSGEYPLGRDNDNQFNNRTLHIAKVSDEGEVFWGDSPSHLPSTRYGPRRLIFERPNVMNIFYTALLSPFYFGTSDIRLVECQLFADVLVNFVKEVEYIFGGKRTHIVRALRGAGNLGESALVNLPIEIVRRIFPYFRDEDVLADISRRRQLADAVYSLIGNIRICDYHENLEVLSNDLDDFEYMTLMDPADGGLELARIFKEYIDTEDQMEHLNYDYENV